MTERDMWFPIDTAPRAGGICILLHDGVADPVVGFFHGGVWLERWTHEEFKNPKWWAPIPPFFNTRSDVSATKG